MVWNEKLRREVPKGWGNYPLSEIGDIIGGSTPSKAKKEFFTTGGQGIPWITPKDLSSRKGKRFISYGEYDVTEAGRKAASLKIMPKGTVLLSSRAPVGYMAIARESVTTNQGFKSLVPVEGFSTEYLFLTVELYLPAIIKKASGSTFAEISASTLKTVEIAAPPQKLIEEFTAIVAPMFAKQDVLEQENQELASLRDWLLPMLMNGQVKVGEAEEYVQEGEVGMAAEGEIIFSQDTLLYRQIFVMAKIIDMHNDYPYSNLGHVKMEKILHFVEKCLSLELGREHRRLAAGPADSKRLKKAITLANELKYFKDQEFLYSNSDKTYYRFIKRSNFKEALDKYQEYFVSDNVAIENLIHKFLSKSYEETQIAATVFDVWESLLRKTGAEPTDEEIINEAKYNYHDEKRKIPKEEFRKELWWLKEQELKPNIS